MWGLCRVSSSSSACAQKCWDETGAKSLCQGTRSKAKVSSVLSIEPHNWDINFLFISHEDPLIRNARIAVYQVTVPDIQASAHLSYIVYTPLTW